MSSYDEYLEQLKQMHQTTAREGTKILYELLKKEDPNLSKEDMYDRIMKDCLEIWSRQTIIHNMPDELKDRERQETGKKGAEAKREMTVTNDGTVAIKTKANQTPVEQKEPESPTFHSVDETLTDDNDDQKIPAVCMPKPQFDDFIQRNNELERENKELKEAIEKMNLFNKASEIPAIAQEQPQVTEFYTSMEKFTLLNEWRYRGEKGWYSKVDPASNTVISIEARSVRVRAETLAKLKEVKAK